MLFNKLIEGAVSSEVRKRVKQYVMKHKEEYDQYVVLSSGQFSVESLLIDCGIPTTKIISYVNGIGDIILGNYFEGSDCERGLDVDFTTDKDGLDKVAFFLYKLKQQQIKGSNYYEWSIKEHVNTHEKELTDQIKRSLVAFDKFKGMMVDTADINDIIETDFGERTLVFLNPVGYERELREIKALDNNEEATMRLSCGKNLQKYNTRNRWQNTFRQLLGYGQTTILTALERGADDLTDYVVFAKEKKVGDVDYVLCTKPEGEKIAKFAPSAAFRKYENAEVFTSGEITEDSVIQFVKVPGDIALYYRDLFAHKLGNSKAESYFLGFIDGKLWCTSGYHSSSLLKGDDDEVFEVFGFTSEHPLYPRLNRLFMEIITSIDFKPVIESTVSTRNRVYTLNGLKTTCLSKYREVKLNSGILKLRETNRMPNDLYKMVYYTDRHKRTWKETIKQFLLEESGKIRVLKNGVEINDGLSKNVVDFNIWYKNHCDIEATRERQRKKGQI